MLILDLVINDEAIDKLAARGILRIEVEQVIANGPAVGDNPSPRVAGSKLVVGPTDAARFLTLVLQPDDDSATRWHLMTAWESPMRQIALFHDGR
jgi:hypothetical protein